ncbi:MULTISPECIES: C39 family peptidase [unclassified Burkholderia]|uniref:C39 family peptidase n=1 Tax=unclassified Burkholderia TaxID=2613784 RepID=UPI0007C7F982|nr:MULTISPECIES: C39 family peptidase [unclassified Burkholderia]
MIKIVPYFSQWESRSLVGKFLTRDILPEDDPLWYQSGAASAAEYARWSPNICGMACLKMLLAYRLNITVPLLYLVREAVKFGVYRPELGDSGMRLLYAPFVNWVNTRYALNAEVVERTRAIAVEPLLRTGHVLIASVHPSIRHAPTITPSARGGHLVLAFDVDRQSDEWVFHNPSGLSVETQENVRLPRLIFEQFFANRGILIAP